MVADDFGGLEFMKNRYPRLYRLFSNSVNAAPKQISNDPPGFIDIANIHYIEKKSQSTYISNGSSALTKECHDMHLVLKIYQGDKLIGRGAASNMNATAGSVTCESDELDEIYDDINPAVAELSSYWVPKDKDILCGLKSSRKAFVRHDAIFNSTCGKPIKIIEQYKEKIIIVYGRGAARSESRDYEFKEGRDAENNQRVYLDMFGTITLIDGYKFKELAAGKAVMTSKTRGGINYNGDKVTCDYDAVNRIITWHFKEDWKKTIPCSVQFGSDLFEIIIEIDFYVTDQSGNSLPQGAYVSGTLDPPPIVLPHISVIPPLMLVWSCLASDTPIQMADDSVKLISEIQIGDLVKTPGGQAKVSNIWKGPDKTMHTIITKNKITLRASLDHPFMTEDGFAKVGQFDNKTKLKLADGNTTLIQDCYHIEYDGLAYGLDLENADSFYCAGLISGTTHVQNTLCAPKPSHELDPEMLKEHELIKEDFAAGKIFNT